MINSNTLPLHPKFGMNPTMKICFFCGKETGEIVLLGNAYPKEAPLQMVTDYEPCEKCVETFSRGFLLIEAVDTMQGPKPTGSHWLLTLEAADRLLNDMSKFPEHKAFISPEMAKKLGLYAQNEDAFINT